MGLSARQKVGKRAQSAYRDFPDDVEVCAMGGVGTWVEELWIWLVAVFSTTVEKVGVVLTILALIEKIPRVRHFLSEKPILDRSCH
jgi:hypothetical protein